MQTANTLIDARCFSGIIEMNPSKRKRLTHKYCPHCGKDCNIKTYRDHKRLFFNRDSKSWYCESFNAAQEATEDSSSLGSEGTHSQSDRELSPPLFEENVSEDIYGE